MDLTTLRNYRWVYCQLCRMRFRGREIEDHNNSESHKGRYQSHVIDEAINKVDNSYYPGCNRSVTLR